MKKLPNRELLCYSYIAFRPLNHLERATHHWNARKAIGTCEAPLERPQGNWNVRSTIGTPEGQLEPSGTCEALLELREAHNLSAEREVRAGNRSCSAIRDFLCVRVLVG